ncbi:MAG: protein kinase family protein [Akkermansia sp.]|nr:protein kinase family protein [Akkermansia sp.]
MYSGLKTTATAGKTIWDNLEQVFSSLNDTIPYVRLHVHEDSDAITLLTTQKERIIDLLHAHPAHSRRHSSQYLNLVAGKQMTWNIRWIGDSYYCAEWEAAMIQERRLCCDGYYQPSPHDVFFSEVYHAVMHKNSADKVFLSRLQEIYHTLPERTNIDYARYPSALDVFYGQLCNYMQRKSYTFCKPVDESVFYNEHLQKSQRIIAELTSLEYLNHVELLRIHMGENPKQRETRLFFKGRIDQRDVFIKWGSPADVCKNEYELAETLYKACPELVIRPAAHGTAGESHFIAYEYLNCPTLAEEWENGIPEERKQCYIRQLAKLANALQETGVVHRDIRPANFMVTQEGVLKLHDFEYAVHARHYREVASLSKKYAELRHLGADYALALWKWDDMHSLALLMKKLGAEKTNKLELTQVLSLIGKQSIIFPNRHILLALRPVLKFISRFAPISSWRKKIRNIV